MRRRISRLGKGVVVLLLVVAVWWTYGLLPSSQGVGPVSDELGEVIIPSFEVKEASINEAVEQLEKVVRAHESTQHLRVLLWNVPDLPEGFRAEIKPTESSTAIIPGLERPKEGEDLPATAAEPRWSLSVANIPLADLMRYVSRMYNCTVGQTGNNLYVVQAKGRFGRTEKKVLKVKYPEQFGLSPSSTKPVDVRGYFAKNGMQFFEGDSAVYYPRSRRLVVRGFQDEIDLVDPMFWECSYRARPPTAWELAVEWLDYYGGKIADAYYNAAL